VKEKSPKDTRPHATERQEVGSAACTQDPRSPGRVPEPLPLASGSPRPKLLDQLRGALRSRHYSRRTEQTYVMWVKRFTVFHNLRHPAELAEPEINAFLTHLAVKEKVSSSTQNQALSALLFLYQHVPGVCSCPMRLTASTPMRPPSGAGNSCFRRSTGGSIGAPAEREGTTCTSPSYRKPSMTPPAGLASPSERPATRCGTRLPRICSRPGMTSALSRSFSGTRMCGPR